MTISLSPELRKNVARTAKTRGTTESEFVRQALQTQLRAEALEETRRQLQPLACSQGILTDEDVFAIVS